MFGAVILSSTDAASQEPVVGSAQRVVVERARAPRDAAVQHCLEYLRSEHPDFELERSAQSVIQVEGILREAAPCVANAPIDVDEQVSIVVDVPPEVYELEYSGYSILTGYYVRSLPTYPLFLPCDPPLLFVYCQVNSSLWYFL